MAKSNNMEWKEFAKEQPEQGQKVIAAVRLGKGEYHYFIATYKMGNFFTYTQAVSTGLKDEFLPHQYFQ